MRDAFRAALVVLESHLSLISSASDRLAALAQGEVPTEGPPAEVLAHSPVVTSFPRGVSAVIGRSNVTQPEPA